MNNNNLTDDQIEQAAHNAAHNAYNQAISDGLTEKTATEIATKVYTATMEGLYQKRDGDMKKSGADI
jgi:FKBP-type peptidyl-prolyl cis-trans isomerase (trigger factor)